MQSTAKRRMVGELSVSGLRSPVTLKLPNCRLLYIVGRLRAGGLERQLCYLLKAMDRGRYAPAVAAWNYSDDDFYVDQLREMEVALYAPPPGISGASKLIWLRSLARQLGPEVIHSYSFYTNFAAWYAAVANRVRAVGSVRSDFARAKREAGFCLGRLCARWPRVQIFNSFTAAESAQNSYSPFRPRQLFVVRNGIDLDRFTWTPLPKGARPEIIAVGSLTAVKRWDRLLNTAFQLKQEGFQFLLRIVGEGPLRKSLEQQANDLGIKDWVEFVGQRYDVPALLAKAACLVLTSQSEGCPNVVMEAMACGRPVVATEVGDVPSLVDDGETGFVVRRGDDNTLAERIGTLIRNGPLSERMSEAARLKAEREFGLDRLMRQTLVAYREAGWLDRNESFRKKDAQASDDKGRGDCEFTRADCGTSPNL